jgi:4-amino-4-deoxy-L-arabinose transferase
VVNRVSSAQVRRNAQWYGAFRVYIPTLLLGTLPWCWPMWRRAFRALVAPRAALEALGADADTRMLVLWVALPLGVFALSRSRLPFYLLPLFAPLALLAARALPPRLPRWTAPGLVLWLAALLALRAWFAQLPSKEDDRRLAADVRALGLESVDEIAFVDSVPRYGLGFYLGSEIERLSVDYDPNARVVAEHFDDEIKEIEGCRLVLLEPETVPKMRNVLARLQVQVQALGNAGEFEAFAVPAQSCRRRAGG